jgi:hypothetical protein
MRARTPLLVTGLALAAVAAPGAWALATASSPDPAPALPELPSVAEQVAGLYDADGCLVTGPGQADCTVRADDVDEALSHGPATETRHLEGFVGSRWLGQVSGRGPVVVAPSVTLGTTGSFTASGLARNEGSTLVDTLEVTAQLLDDSGAVLATETVAGAVHDVRPGEPVPFTLQSDVPASAVARVEWSATATGEGDAAARAFAWTPYWERPVGGPAVDLYLHRDSRGPRPYLLFGAAASVGSTSVDQPEVVVAWLTADGHLASIATAPLSAPDGSALSALDAGASADALVTAAANPPAGGEAIVWVQGS